MNQTDLNHVCWDALPKPVDDGMTSHLLGQLLPDCWLSSTDGSELNIASLMGWSVLYFHPMMGQPDVALPENWDEIPGARGCTPQSCAFRDHKKELEKAGVSHIFGISTQPTHVQIAAVERLHLPFALLSDKNLELTRALKLPTFTIEGQPFIKRLTLIVQDSSIRQIFYPIFPPHQNAAQVLQWMRRGTSHPNAKTDVM